MDIRQVSLPKKPTTRYLSNNQEEPAKGKDGDDEVVG